MVEIISKLGGYTLSKIDNVYQVEHPDGSKENFPFRANAELYIILNNYTLNYYSSLR